MASNTQIDRLGDRLRKGDISDEDLRALDEYRLSFSDAYEFVIGLIRKTLALEPTGRPAKSTKSIIEKLVRESIRLSQIQDIAGCRVVVRGLAEQNRAVTDLTTIFENATIVDRRERPSHGYRAIHVIVKKNGKLVEVQVRSALQHEWAELSEKASDLIDPEIKYGRGVPDLAEMLLSISSLFAKQEQGELEFEEFEARFSSLLSLRDVPPDLTQELDDLRGIIDKWRKRLTSAKVEIMQILKDEGSET
jgi:ppGpp synthetase/RelA/SpoT-type nucleotidyltranferase